MKQVIYTDKLTNESIVLAEVSSNHSMTVWEALDAAGVDMDEYAAANDWEGWDAEAITLKEKTMTRKEIMKTFAMLARSQGSYTRLYNSLRELEADQPDDYDTLMIQLEEENFKDAVDLIMYVEC